jgi:peptide chain release factor 2
MKCEVIFDLENKEKEVASLEKEVSHPRFWEDSQRARGVTQKLNSLKEKVETWEKLKKREEDLKVLAQLFEEEEEESLISEIEQEVQSLSEELKKLEFKKVLSGKYDRSNAIFTIHSGAGGTESCDWAEMLLRMYLRWAEKKGYKTEIIDILPGEEAGIKSVTALITGEYTYGHLKGEIGVHRLVRISPFDANKRRHTSFASFFAYPEVDEAIEVKIEPKDLRIDTYRASGHGGQHVNVTDSAVRVTHLPTGIVAQCQKERSQHRNKAIALKVLRARLHKYYEDKEKEARTKDYKEKGEIAWGNQIRSYVFQPYQMVKDHRTGIEVGDVEKVMDGEINKFIEEYLKKARESRFQ